MGGWGVRNPPTIDGIGCVSDVNVHTGPIHIGWLNRRSQDQSWNPWLQFDGIETINTIRSLPALKDKGVLESIGNWLDWMCVRCGCAYWPSTYRAAQLAIAGPWFQPMTAIKPMTTILSPPAWKGKGILESIDYWLDWMCVRCGCAYWPTMQNLFHLALDW